VISFSSFEASYTVEDRFGADDDDGGLSRGCLHRRSSAQRPQTATMNLWGSFVPAPGLESEQGIE